MRIVIASALLMAAAACQQPAVKSDAKVDTAAATDAIQKLEEAQVAAIVAKDATKSTELYAKDAVFMDQSGKLTTGEEAINGNFAQFLSDPALEFDYQPGAKTFSDDGTMAYSTASYTESFTDPATKKVVTIKGTNLSVWRRQEDGSWKLVADSNPGAVAE